MRRGSRCDRLWAPGGFRATWSRQRPLPGPWLVFWVQHRGPLLIPRLRNDVEINVMKPAKVKSPRSLVQ